VSRVVSWSRSAAAAWRRRHISIRPSAPSTNGSATAAAAISTPSRTLSPTSSRKSSLLAAGSPTADGGVLGGVGSPLAPGSTSAIPSIAASSWASSPLSRFDATAVRTAASVGSITECEVTTWKAVPVVTSSDPRRPGIAWSTAFAYSFSPPARRALAPGTTAIWIRPMSRSTIRSRSRPRSATLSSPAWPGAT
jgi:hypothetical protein